MDHYQKSRVVAGGVAALVSVALHALLVGSVLLTEGGHSPRAPAEDGLGANAIASDQEATATLMLIEDPSSSAPAGEPLPSMASHGKILQNLRLTVVSPEPKLDLPFDGENDAVEQADASVADLAAERETRAALFGRYLAQIQARVERAWRRPRTPIGAERFECHLQLAQNARGEVLETTLQRCNGDARWQVSLVNALERASPLPAPPDPKVFAESLQLSFHATAFEPGTDEEDFEPPGIPAIH